MRLELDYRRLAFALAVIALVLWFALANRHEVTITWWLVDVETTLIVVIVVSALLGALAARLIGRRSRDRR